MSPAKIFAGIERLAEVTGVEFDAHESIDLGLGERDA
jgi:hypothetical protein